MLAFVLALLAASGIQATPPAHDRIQLEIRVFFGTEEVTQDTKVNVYPAGRRESALVPRLVPGTGHVLSVTPGLYDVQAIRQREGQILNIRWAEQLLVIRYPDEAGAHLQVLNFKFGFGALQLKPYGDALLPADWNAAAFTVGDRTREAGQPLTNGRDGRYSLFVLPAGKYDFLIRQGSQSTWVADLEVPLDHTRLKQIPAGGNR